jgi:membrane peptidoglycan carboxypeptidase
LQAALIAMSPRSGEILAMVGGESLSKAMNQLNRTVQMRRQTGSAMKPFIYAKALSQHLIHRGDARSTTRRTSSAQGRDRPGRRRISTVVSKARCRHAMRWRSRGIYRRFSVGRLVGRESV